MFVGLRCGWGRRLSPLPGVPALSSLSSFAPEAPSALGGDRKHASCFEPRPDGSRYGALSASWLYVAHHAHVAARHRGRVLRPGQAERVCRVVLQSPVARSVPSRAVISGAPLGARRRGGRSLS